jgi:hypothetical protein
MKTRASAVLLCAGVAMAGCGSAGEGGREAMVAQNGNGHSVYQEMAKGHVCGWLHEYPQDAALTELAYDTFAVQAAELDAVHPKWWRVASPTTFANHPYDRSTPFGGFHDRRVLDNTTPGGKPTRLEPLVAAVFPPDVGYAHTMINDPALRREHVEALVALVLANGYDGVDVDYEHLDRALGPGQTMATERAAFATFVEELSAALHAQGKTLSLALPLWFDGPFDFAALSAAVDEVHLMAYDLHYYGSPHAGPTAPLGFVREGIAGALRFGPAGKFILGLPNYGIVGPEEPTAGQAVTMCEPLKECLALVGGHYATTTTHMEHCNMGHDEAGRSPNGRLPDGRSVFFDDLASLEEKVVEAQRAGLGGVTVWAIGGTPTGPGGQSLFEMIRAHFPRR